MKTGLELGLSFRTGTRTGFKVWFHVWNWNRRFFIKVENPRAAGYYKHEQWEPTRVLRLFQFIKNHLFWLFSFTIIVHNQRTAGSGGFSLTLVVQTQRTHKFQFLENQRTAGPSVGSSESENRRFQFSWKRQIQRTDSPPLFGTPERVFIQGTADPFVWNPLERTNGFHPRRTAEEPVNVWCLRRFVDFWICFENRGYES